MSYNKILTKENYLLLILYITLIASVYLGFFLNENSTGGAQQDYLVHKEISLMFKTDFFTTLMNYDNLKTRHSPIIPIYFSFYNFFEISDKLIRLIHLHASFFITIIFYQCIKLKYGSYNKKILIFISLLLLLSPTIRSLAIWPDSHLYGLFFFLISVFWYLKFLTHKNKFIYIFLNILFLAIASYIRPSFCLFSIYFTYNYYRNFNFCNKFYFIIFINALLALPAFYYLFYLDIMFLTSNAVSNVNLNIRLNPANKILIISSIIFFHLLPILIIKFQFFKDKIKEINFYEIILVLFLFLILLYYFNYELSFTGGGIFLHLSLFFDNIVLFHIICLFSLFFVYLLGKNSLDNSLILIILILINPQLTIYHKYYDPLVLIVFFLLININMKKLNFDLKKMSLFYFHSLFFLILNIIK